MALSYAFNANAGETPQTLAQRRQLADTIASRIFGQAPKNLGEGLNAVGQALIARSMLDETDAAQKAGLATVPSWLGGTGTATATPASVPDAATPPALTAAPMGNLPTPQSSANTSAKIYSNDEPSPLDPPSDNDRQALIATILGEAGNQGPAGMNAVASVVRNRAVNGGFGGDAPAQVVTAKNQFEPWNTAQGRAKMATAMQSPQQVAAANAAIDSAYAGNDPTNGATMFYSPTVQAALGRTAPAWAQGPSQDIGDHRFYGGAPVPPTQVAQAGQATQEDSGGPALAFAGQPTQSASPIPQVTQTAPQPAQPKSYGGPFPNVSTEDLTKQAFNPWIPASTKQILSAEITRRATADQQANDPLRQLQIRKAETDLAPVGQPYHDDAGNLVQKDALGKVTVLSAADKAPSSVSEYKYYADQERSEGRTPLPYGQWDTARRRSGATSISTGTIPQGYEQYTDPASGAIRMRPIPGGPKDTTAKDQAKADARATSTDVVTNAANLARQAISSSSLPATGTVGNLLSNVGETGAAELYRQVGVLKSNATIENLNAMRAQSPTGGALGNVTEGEGAMLAAKSGALDPRAGGPQFQKALNDYERTLLRIVHGKEQGDKIYNETRTSPANAGPDPAAVAEARRRGLIQ